MGGWGWVAFFLKKIGMHDTLFLCINYSFFFYLGRTTILIYFCELILRLKGLGVACVMMS